MWNDEVLMGESAKGMEKKQLSSTSHHILIFYEDSRTPLEISADFV